MTTNAFSLLLKHRQLDDAIRDAQRTRWPDMAHVQRLKKMKLAIKDRLHRLASARRTPRPV